MRPVLGAVPQVLEDELFEKFRKIERNFHERRWEPAELNGGKLCEVAYCILRGHVDGSFPAKSYKPANFYDACLKLEREPASLGRSVRIQLPRMLIAQTSVTLAATSIQTTWTQSTCCTWRSG